MPNIRTNLTGQKFGRLTVVSEAERRDKHPRWNCVCECGKTSKVYSFSLKSGGVKSCGCLQLEFVSKLNRKHGAFKTPEYTSWEGMKQRCENPNNNNHKHYGGRGITICDRWKKFENFLLDMGKRPSLKHSLERENVDGNYCPENCVWATMFTQQRNRRNNRYFEYKEIRMIATDWAIYFGVCFGSFMKSIKRRGMENTYLFYLNKNGSLPVIPKSEHTPVYSPSQP